MHKGIYSIYNGIDTLKRPIKKKVYNFIKNNFFLDNNHYQFRIKVRVY